MAVAPKDHRLGTSRAAGAWGWAFTVLLLLSAGMASVPGGDDAVSTVRTFYGDHAGVVVVAQAISLLASATFVPFALTLRPRAARHRTGLGGPEAAGLAVAAASVLTVFPVLTLTVLSDSASDSGVHRLAVASDLVDVVLFLAIGAFAGTLAAAAAATWCKVLSAVVAVLAVARAVELLVGWSVLELAAPVAFIVLVVVLSTLTLLRRSPFSPHEPG